ncbi:MAG: DNA-directed RNA polymerase subunit omega [Chlorobium sp.]|uniref:DNA-directed RNA polymerase subunit omega n=1 Tax=Chlorobium sp. TaxID=1095 RepID=UPI0025C05B36|nr:DNA-directed RNA polymerase subunit omega [Chlorobium sp.]MCF8382592.1 DNA-directed RNA polymerase subunit omega [Chlorobium sp.]
MSVKPVDLNTLRSAHSNLYETVVAISKRARQIHEEERSELEEKLLPYKEMIRNPASESESDRIFPEQIAISLEFEGREKASHKAVGEYLAGKYDYAVEKSIETKPVPAEDDETDGD